MNNIWQEISNIIRDSLNCKFHSAENEININYKGIDHFLKKNENYIHIDNEYNITSNISDFSTNKHWLL